MTLTRRQFGRCLLAAAATAVTAGRASAAVRQFSFDIWSSLTAYGGGIGSLEASIASLGDGSVRIGFTAINGSWKKAVTHDFDSSNRPSGQTHVIGSGNFRSISSDFLRLPKPRVAVWAESTDRQVWFQKLTSAGAPAGSRSSIRSLSWGISGLWAIVLTDGRFLVVWLDSLLGQYVGQIVSADGAKVGATFDAAPGAVVSATNIAEICLAALPGGAFATAFRNNRTGLVQRFTAAGARRGAAVVMETAAAAVTGLPGLACFANGDLLAVYGAGNKVRARRLTAAGGKAIFFEYPGLYQVGGIGPLETAPKPAFTDNGAVVIGYQHVGSDYVKPGVNALAYDVTGQFIGMKTLFTAPHPLSAGIANARVDTAVALPAGEVMIGFAYDKTACFQRLTVS